MNTAHLKQVVSQSVAAVAAQLVSVSATWCMYSVHHTTPLTPAGEEMPPRGPPIYSNTLSRQYRLGKLLKNI